MLAIDPVRICTTKTTQFRLSHLHLQVPQAHQLRYESTNLETRSEDLLVLVMEARRILLALSVDEAQQLQSRLAQ
jgi:hypothetical protein